MSFESWEDADVNWEDPRIAPMWNALEAIRLALVERASVASYTLPIILQSEVVRLKLIYDYTYAIQTAVTTLIPLFVNHTDHDGDWDELLYSGEISYATTSNNSFIVPLWTEAAILAAIGAESRLTAPRLAVTPDWIIQQYDIINMLKWTKTSVWNLYGYGSYVKLYLSRRGETGYEYNSVVESIDTIVSIVSSYTPYPEILFPGIETSCNKSLSGSTYFYQGGCTQCEVTFHVDSLPITPHSAVFYILPGYPGIEERTIFDANGMSFTERTIKAWTTFSETSDTEIVADKIGDTSSSVFPKYPNEPAGETKTYETFRGWYIAWAAFVLKFDGPNGFKFKNWE